MLLLQHIATAQIITTYAGDKYSYCVCEGLPATDASIFVPTSMAFDTAGNLYVTELNNHCIRKITKAGLIYTIAGKRGYSGYSGDGGPASAAMLYFPNCLATDYAGNLYIGDRENLCVRKIDPSGIITTFAGNTDFGDEGDGGPATDATFSSIRGIATDVDGSVYVLDGTRGRVRRINRSGTITAYAGGGAFGYLGDGGPATKAYLNTSRGLSIDKNKNLYIGEQDGNRVRRVDSNGIITTVAGTVHHGFRGDGEAATIARLYGPAGTVTDKAGNLYIADQYNHRIRKVNPSGIITTFAGTGEVGPVAPRPPINDGGSATDAGLYAPEGMAIDDSGNMYIADTYNYLIRKVSFSTVAVANTAPTYADIIISPNPVDATGLVNVYTPKEMQYNCINAIGQTIASGILKAGDNSISLSLAPKGLYMLELKANGYNSVWKIVKL